MISGFHDPHQLPTRSLHPLDVILAAPIMAFQGTCRRASGLFSIEGATLRTCTRGHGTATSSSGSRHTLLSSPSSSSTSSSRCASRRTKSTFIPQSTFTQTTTSSVSSTARFSNTAAPRDEVDEQSATIGSPFAPQQTTDQVRAWFKERFPSFQLPDMMLLRLVTHESFDHGKSMVGNNRRLSFLGRRAMHMFLSVFLHSNLMVADSTASESVSVPRLSRVISDLLARQEHMDELLLTARLGDGVGRKLGLEEVMRWQPALSDGQRGPKETGLFKIRGVTVEAFVGAIYHHHVSSLGAIDRMTNRQGG